MLMVLANLVKLLNGISNEFSSVDIVLFEQALTAHAVAISMIL